MTCWHPLLKRTLLAGLVLAGVGARPEPAQALPGVGVVVGGGAHFVTSGGGFAYSVIGNVDVMGWGAAGHYWQQPASSTNWVSLALRRNLSPIPTISIAPGIGVAMGGSPAGNAVGPLGQVSAGWYPPLMPFALDASVGAAWLNGSMALPYALGVKLSLIPFTALVARWRGWEGAGFIKTSGPEIGAEIGF
jgi:hypothetical protein